jgi:hypothetical protein
MMGGSNVRGRKPAKLAATAKRRAGTIPNDRSDDDVQLNRRKRRTERALPPITKVRSSAPPARPGGLDNVDGGLERGGYS